MERAIAGEYGTTPIEKHKAKSKSPFLLENATRTVPHTTPSLYTRDLFERSDKAVEQLKQYRGRVHKAE
ncbi:hypothetical protein WQ54_21445 [Bacillus sp. SA1-12]|uniref:hypothetical protein n=1 Tax=Bacillus sp. SA1-12 TaxID=1455638 RepID=UPI0006271CEC|nr:hypothetical protein [Bacillus sp. SA1-12]KKI90511.1 hypothetical protein WQ54_21445 [Bacillus sp. SA1-12]